MRFLKITQRRFKETLEIHSVISIGIFKWLKLEKNKIAHRARLLKAAIEIVDKLDYLLEKRSDHLQEYLENHHELLLVLEHLKLKSVIQQEITLKFGAHHFFTHPFQRNSQ